MCVIVMLFAIAPGSNRSYANSGKRPSSVHSKAMILLQQDFPQAHHVVWSEEGKSQIAIFKAGSRKIKCLFSENGRLESTFITSCDAGYLPFELQASLNRKFPGYVPKTITEYITNNRHDYYVLLRNRQDNIVKWMRVKSDEDGNAIQIIQKLHQNV